jgi:hypothetical protein
MAGTETYVEVPGGVVRKQGNNAFIWIQAQDQTYCLQRTEYRGESNGNLYYGEWAQALEDGEKIPVFCCYYYNGVGPWEDRRTGFPMAFPPMDQMTQFTSQSKTATKKGTATKTAKKGTSAAPRKR